MTVEFTYSVTADDDGALVVPYPADHGGGRTNHGFIDLRGRPAQARAIVEAQPSPAFRDLLVQLADPGSRYFSIGCELGGMELPAADGTVNFSAGAYLQIAASDLHSNVALHRGEQEKLADRLRDHLEPLSEGHSWQVECIVSVIMAEALGGPEQIWSPLIYMHAQGSSPEAAVQSAEVLFASLATFLG
jgi:hypothetical protein